ncbi:MAG: ATP-binding protein [Chlamydiae bacterium]|jgi:anti-sigma regulatory factor (Ser/Thr protein kinase)|nr:ATP-binding protein [Chlamydiota bacterium]
MTEADYKKDKAQFQGELTNLSAMMKWIVDKVDQVGFPLSDSRKIQLAMEEALVNVIHYAYPDRVGMIEIISFLLPQKLIKFEIIDQGKEFNPLQFSTDGGIDADLLDRQEGGLGIILIKKIMDEVHYERRNERNVLTIVKEFEMK